MQDAAEPSIVRPTTSARTPIATLHPHGPIIMVEPSLAIVGHEQALYCAYPCTGDVDVLSPDLDWFERLSTESIRGFSRLLVFYRKILSSWVDHGTTGCLGRFFRPVLENLARNAQAQ
jgi:hypothetical protein